MNRWTKAFPRLLRMRFFEWLPRITKEVGRIFDLGRGFDDANTVKNIKSGIDFRGENTVLLICAIFIASIGLNINSTAVVIGAMLISPLMGPIVGAGVAIRINDLKMLQDAAYHLFLMVTVSITTSTIYFLISPLSQAASELLARTKPTAYDVMIAVFGGVAGVLTATRRERATNVVAGAAIATALMPPLCTLGYGLANLRPDFILGAGYLFIINAFFIGFSTIAVTWFMPFEIRHTVDQATEKMIQRVIVIGGIALLVPSLVTGYRSVREIMINARVDSFISGQMNFPRSRVLDRKVNLTKSEPVIDITMVGDPLGDDSIDALRRKLKVYDLRDADLNITNISTTIHDSLPGEDLNKTAAANMNKVVSEASDKISSLELKIVELETELAKYKKIASQADPIAAEVKAIFPNFQGLALGTLEDPNGGQPKQVAVAIAKWKSKPSSRDRNRLREFLRARTSTPDLELVDSVP